jgi:hypothetical protein
MNPRECPNAPEDSFLRGHVMRLEEVLDGDRELWVCARCGWPDVAHRSAKCGCGELLSNPAPNWCGRRENHGS